MPLYREFYTRHVHLLGATWIMAYVVFAVHRQNYFIPPQLYRNKLRAGAQEEMRALSQKPLRPDLLCHIMGSCASLKVTM